MSDHRSKSWIGASLPRRDGPEKAAGTAIYPQDRSLPPGCLHAATVRAPVACAQLNAVDVRAALGLRGVVRVLTAADVLGSNRFGLIEPDQPVLVETHIAGPSDVVALVVATNERIAREGALHVELSLTKMTPVLDPERALHPDAASVQPEREGRDNHPNLLAERVVRRGDIDGALRGAAVIVEGTYTTGRVEHAFLAPEAGIATPDLDGGLTLYVATQWPAADLRQAAAALGEPAEALHLVQDEVGGAFGGREDVSLQILLFLAARATGKPVRMVWDRAESVRGHGKRHPFRVHHRLALDGTGRILAMEADLLIDAGCYASTSSQLLDNALAHLCGPYDVPDVSLVGHAVLTNNAFTTAFRGFGVNQAAFVVEQQVNKAAIALGLNPAELRVRNLIEGPAVLGGGSEINSVGGLSTTVRMATETANRSPLGESSPTVAHGRGLATAIKNLGFGFSVDDHSTAEVTLTPAGALVCVGAAEVGQGAETALIQIAASVLGLHPDLIRIEWRDTRIAPDAGSSSASRQTVASGNAVLGACERVLRRVHDAGGLGSLPGACASARHTWRFPTTVGFDQRPGRHLAAFGYATCVADVRVDRGTGRVDVIRVVNAMDVGRVVNPALLRGQVEGGIVMGQGYALQESFDTCAGMPTSVGFESCAIPTAVDAVPIIESLVVEVPEAVGPFGARGVGEIVMIPVVPAITAAIHTACGVWIDELPASPDRVLAALEGLA